MVSLHELDNFSLCGIAFMINLELNRLFFLVLGIHSLAIYSYFSPSLPLPSSLSPSLTPLRRYSFMEGRGCSMQSFRVSTIGRMVTHCVLTVLETLSVAPKGVTKVHSVLQVAASSLIKSGRMEIFTPMFRVVARKPGQE